MTLTGHDIDHQERGDSYELPFLRDIEVAVDGGSLKAHIRLDLAEHRFLRHHKFVHASGVKDDEYCLPVLPFSIGLELLAESAAPLAGGFGLLGFRDVRSVEWIQLVDVPTLELLSEVQLRESTPAVRLLEVTIRQAHEGRASLTGTVVFGKRYRQSIDFSLEETVISEVQECSPATLYESRELFHGPLFQCLSGPIRLSSNSVMGNVRTALSSTLFESPVKRELYIEPVALDGVSQLLAVWGMRNNVYPFPATIEALEFYQATPKVVTPLPVFIHVRQFSHRFLIGDLELQNGAGDVWIRCRGLRMWCFHWPKNYHLFRCNPKGRILSTTALEGSSPERCTVRVSSADIEDGILEQIARYYLSHQEGKEYNLISGDGERASWLLERIAAKDAYRTWLAVANSEMPHPASFSLQSREGRGSWRVLSDELRTDVVVTSALIQGQTYGFAEGLQ